MHGSVERWVLTRLPLIPLIGAAVVDLGGRNENGTMRPAIEAAGVRSYVSVDMVNGAGVDVVSKAEDFAQDLGQWDLVISTEMLEHCEHWQDAVLRMKELCCPGGHILLTCRGPGFAFHGYPSDYWRFTPADLAHAFRDFFIHDVCGDPDVEGAFIHVQRLNMLPPERPTLGATAIRSDGSLHAPPHR